MITQSELDPDIPAFREPTTFVGPALDDAGVAFARDTRHVRVARDGAAWRRVVSSPRPQAIVERDTIGALVERHCTVVCAGDGGVLEVRELSGHVRGVEAVIDTDRASSLLARQIDAEPLVILTQVDGVMKDFGTPEARRLSRVTVDELTARGLPDGSMGPQVEAACDVAATERDSPTGCAGIAHRRRTARR